MSWKHACRQVLRDCKFCGVAFTTTILKQRFCCLDCKQKWHTRPNHAMYLDEVQYIDAPKYKDAIPRPSRVKIVKPKPAPPPMPEPDVCPDCGCRNIRTRRHYRDDGKAEVWQQCHWCEKKGAVVCALPPMRTLIEASIKKWNERK